MMRRTESRRFWRTAALWIVATALPGCGSSSSPATPAPTPARTVTEDFSGSCGMSDRKLFNMGSAGTATASFKQTSFTSAYIVLCTGTGYPCAVGTSNASVSADLPSGQNSFYVDRYPQTTACTYTVSVTHPQ
jgi:hypothetical protein